MAKEKTIDLTLNEKTLAKYECIVRAVKIGDIKNIGNASNPDSAGDGSKIIIPADSKISPFAVSLAYVEACSPEVGGYFIHNEKSGNQSFLKADMFEALYKKI